MPRSNVFNRTAIFTKEEMPDGKHRIRRIPWDLIGYEGSPFCISPMPVPTNFDGRSQTAVYTPDIVDMLSDPSGDDIIDDITQIMYFESEADFYNAFDCVNAFYITDSGQSTEFGYPRT
jgi:hypothetical protein